MGTDLRDSSKAILEEQPQDIQKDNIDTKAENVGTVCKASKDGGLHVVTGQRSLFESVGSEDGDDSRQLAEKALTQSQREALAAFRDCRSTKKAAVKLGIRADTLRATLIKIREKLNVGTVNELLREGDVLIGASSPETVTTARLLSLIEEQQYRCALSGVELTPETAVLDHKTPRAKGGEHVIGNVWFLHRDVNRAKGTMTVEEFRLMCSRVTQWGA